MTSVNSSRSTTSTRHLENLPIDPPGAALRGATLAFRKLSAKPNHLPKTYSGTNGALAAASTVGRGRTPSDSKRLSSSPQTSLETTPARSQDTGSSYGLNAKTPALRSPKNPTLPEGLNADCSRSPSNIAAALAAARASPSLSNASVATPHFYRRFSEQEHNTVSVSERSNEQATLRAKTRSRAPTVSSNDDSAPDFNSKMSSSRSSQTLDLTPIAPTNTLVTMFERNNVGGSGLGAETLPEVQSQTERFPIRSPKPLRPHSMNSPAALFPKTALKIDLYQSSLSSILDPG
ncbi:Increased rDNA silencing protein, partial [Cryomyces antarcticus]